MTLEELSELVGGIQITDKVRQRKRERYKEN